VGGAAEAVGGAAEAVGGAAEAVGVAAAVAAAVGVAAVGVAAVGVTGAGAGEGVASRSGVVGTVGFTSGPPGGAVPSVPVRIDTISNPDLSCTGPRPLMVTVTGVTRNPCSAAR
jgi:hypothetical protein